MCLQWMLLSLLTSLHSFLLCINSILNLEKRIPFQAAYLCRAAAIIAITTTGKTANVCAKYRPLCPIIAVTRFPQAGRQMHLHRGTFPLLYNEERLADWTKDVDERIQFAVDYGKKKGFIKSGDYVICITGWRMGAGSSNTSRVL